MGYIYKITNTINNKIYIGQTRQTPQIRFNRHLLEAKRHTNRYLYDAMNKYGYDNFVLETIEEIEDKNLNEREIYWINYYHSDNKQYGYNMTSGGGGGYTLLNHPHYDEIIQLIRSKNTGKKRTKEQIQKMSLIHKGKYKIQINKQDLYNDIVNFMSIEDLCEKYKISRRGLYLRCQDYFNATPTDLRGDRITHTNSLKIILPKEDIIKGLIDNKTLQELAVELNTSTETIRREIINIFGMNVREVRKYLKEIEKEHTKC